MALITKQSVGGRRSHSEQLGTTLSSIVLAAPGAGYANRVRTIYASQLGGTSVSMRVEMQHSASVQDPTGVIVNLGRVGRTAAATAVSSFAAEPGDNGPVGGNNQQTTITVAGNVNDSLETHLVVVADTVKV